MNAEPKVSQLSIKSQLITWKFKLEYVGLYPGLHATQNTDKVSIERSILG